MMKWTPIAAALLLVGAVEIFAQPATPTTEVNPAQPGSIGAPASRELLLAELDRRRPDEVSPFFADREAAVFLNTPEGRRFVDQQGVPVYPNTVAYDSAGKVFGGIFGSMARTIRFTRSTPADMASLTVTPGTSFSLKDRREINVTFSLTNTGRKLMSLYFPTAQRFDVIIRNSSGTAVETWSNDRVFATQEAAVLINPGEKIEYTATVSTRELKPGETYQVEVSLHDNPAYTRSLTLTPF